MMFQLMLDDYTQYDTKEGIKYIQSAAAIDEENNELNVFVINRSWETDNTIELDVSGFVGYQLLNTSNYTPMTSKHR